MKKLNGAALTLPFSSTVVVTSAIGRGTTTPTQQLVAVMRLEFAEGDTGHLVFRRRHRAGAAGDQAVMLDAAVEREIEDRVPCRRWWRRDRKG